MITKTNQLRDEVDSGFEEFLKNFNGFYFCKDFIISLNVIMENNNTMVGSFANNTKKFTTADTFPNIIGFFLGDYSVYFHKFLI
jgi:hypothetical protein